MRAPIALSSGLAVGLAIAALGCANRGMRAPDDAGTPGTAGTTGIAGSGGSVGAAGRGGSGGSGGTAGSGGAPTGTGGRGGNGGTGTGGGCSLPAGPNMAGGTCGAMFNFETDTQGAAINSGSTAFLSMARSGTATYCGAGALAINARFSGTSGPTIKGEVLIALPGAPVDLTGKTITVRVAADPGCSTDLYLSLSVNTQAGAYHFSPQLLVRPINNTWKTGTGVVTADAGTMSALAISLQAFSSTGYEGTIYIDEIDIR